MTSLKSSILSIHLISQMSPWVCILRNMAQRCEGIHLFTCHLCGAGTIGSDSPYVSVFADLLNFTAVKTLVRPSHAENPQLVHLSLRFLVQMKLWLWETVGVVPIQLPSP